LFDVAARKIALDTATPSPLPDPTKSSRLPEFTTWATGEVRDVMEHVERVIAGLKETSFPDLAANAPVVSAAPAVVVEPVATTERETAAAEAAEPNFRMPPAEPEVIDLRKSAQPVVASEPAEPDWSKPAPVRVRKLTAADEERLHGDGYDLTRGSDV